jgi:hypothetical protein
MSIKRTLIRRYAADARGVERNEEIPAGWSILRTIHETHTEFNLFERGGSTWPQTGEPRAALTVTVYHFNIARERAEVSWPSTSDKRPVLARCLAVALTLAAEYAEEISS